MGDEIENECFSRNKQIILLFREEVLNQVDALVELPSIRVSDRTWLLGAVAWKLEREPHHTLRCHAA